MRLGSLLITVFCILLCVMPLKASPKSPGKGLTAALLERVVVCPSEMRLDSRRATGQFVVTGYFHGEPHDLTHEAVYLTANDRVARLSGSRVIAAGNGRTVITVCCGRQAITVPVATSGCDRPDPIRFKFETLAVLTKQGCATGSCHGSPHGKGGFSLSLFGYDPTIDRISLTRDGFNRRIDVLEPADSLMLKKPLLEIPHAGGKRLHRTDAAYRVLHDWIYEGADVALPSTACERIVVTPNAGRVLHTPYLRQQLSVLAHFTDGSARDVTAIATYDSSSPSVASVDPDGLITGHSRGQTAISVRYLDRLQSIYITVVEDMPGFKWSSPTENNLIDRLVDAKLRQLQYLPSETCGDVVFLRRVTLDLTGMLPTPDRVRRFLNDPAPEKRARLIDSLLETEEYARFWALTQADLMRVAPARLKDGRAERFANWIIEATRANMPYDRFARAILTAQGEAEAVPETGYFIAVPTLEERTQMTAQLFMGTRIECAKCHNHPFENWTMRDYYSIAAVFARTQSNSGEVRAVDYGEAQHPTTHEAMAPWGRSAGMNANADRRAAFAAWLTQPGNPYFARVEVNRIWADLLGRGIVEPVDDFRSSNPPANVPLLDALAQEFERSGYDRKHMIRLICNSRTYQRSTATNRFNATDETLFSHARLRLLSAEQVKDAIGLTTHVLEPTSSLATRLADLRRERASRVEALDANYPTWLTTTAAEITRLPLRVSIWYLAGAFSCADQESGLQREFGPEKQPFDLAAQFAGKIGWTPRPDFRDNQENDLALERCRVHYLCRRFDTTEPRKVTIQLNLTGAALAWLNGKRLTPQPLEGDQALTLDLKAGENRLLLKLSNGQPNGIFTSRFTSDAEQQAPMLPQSHMSHMSNVSHVPLPPYLIDLISTPPARRIDAQREALHALYVAQDHEVSDLQARIDTLQSRMDYATQRPYPESSQFTVTFGQPLRETACTCERQHAPTLLQALELLNGSLAYRMARDGVGHYASLDNGRLIEDLYLSGLSRLPIGRERAIAEHYLARASDRNNAVTDLIWTLVNTREFLFQH